MSPVTTVSTASLLLSLLCRLLDRLPADLSPITPSSHLSSAPCPIETSMDSASHSYCDAGKPAAALRMMREAPEKWFQHLQVDDRDRALLDAACVPFVDYGRRCFLREMV